jgi:hypothetical protein
MTPGGPEWMTLKRLSSFIKALGKNENLYDGKARSADSFSAKTF